MCNYMFESLPQKKNLKSFKFGLAVFPKTLQYFQFVGNAENIFIVKNEMLITPPITSGALDGITRSSILSIAENLGINFRISDISRDELYNADEVFLTGTAAEIKSIGEIDKIIIFDGKTGKIASKLQNYYSEIVHANNKKYENWLTYIN